VHLRSSITFFVMKSIKEKWFSNIYISTDEQISRHFGKASIQDEKFCVLKLEIVKMTLVLKREEMTLGLGGSTDVLFIYGLSFFNSKNGPG
jgi:hypothetical protein